MCVGFLKRTRRRDKERYSKHILFSSSLSSFDFASFFLIFYFFLFVFECNPISSEGADCVDDV